MQDPLLQDSLLLLTSCWSELCWRCLNDLVLNGRYVLIMFEMKFYERFIAGAFISSKGNAILV